MKQPPKWPVGSSSSNGNQQPANGLELPQLTLYPPLDWATKPSPRGALYTRLNQDMAEMVTHQSPQASDIETCRQILQLVHQAVLTALPNNYGLKVEPFGSFTSGLATRDSDLDVVITGVCQPRDGNFYSKNERPWVANQLDRVQRALRNIHGLRIHSMFTIRHARIPLVKMTAALSGGARNHAQPVQVDISMATDSGPAAARYLAQKTKEYPALRPLLLVIKAYLKALGLNEVVSGGLSSYGLTYMIIAHLMAEQAAGNSTTDLGWLLHTFFTRYTRQFSAYTQCISINHGGVALRTRVPSAGYYNLDRICCIDPLTGRDITEGAYRSDAVIAAFSRAATYMDGVATHYIQGVPGGVNVLDGLIGMPSAEDLYEDELGDDDYVGAFEPPAKRMNSNGNRYKPAEPGTQLPAWNATGFTYPDAEQQGVEQGEQPGTGKETRSSTGGGGQTGKDVEPHMELRSKGKVTAQRAQSSPVPGSTSAPPAEGPLVTQQMSKKRSLDVAFGKQGSMVASREGSRGGAGGREHRQPRGAAECCRIAVVRSAVLVGQHCF